MKKILICLLFLCSCTSYQPEIDSNAARSIGDYYNQCRDSEGIDLSNIEDKSISERYYCVGYTQAMAETIFYWRKRVGDIDGRCSFTVGDFYREVLHIRERGIYTYNTPVIKVFMDVSYSYCPSTRG